MRKKKNILVVEDDENDIELLLQTISKVNFKTEEMVVVKDGAQALDYLTQQGNFADRADEDPIFVLLDLKLPRIDGLTVLEKVKKDKDLKKIPVVMFSSSQQERDVLKAYELGANAYMVKPVQYQDFTRVVNNAFNFWTTINKIPENV